MSLTLNKMLISPQSIIHILINSIASPILTRRFIYPFFLFHFKLSYEELMNWRVVLYIQFKMTSVIVNNSGRKVIGWVISDGEILVAQKYVTGNLTKLLVSDLLSLKQKLLLCTERPEEFWTPGDLTPKNI